MMAAQPGSSGFPVGDAFAARQALADSLWSNLAGESLFLTGGSGLFGQWFLESMLDANRRLGVDIRASVLTRNPGAFGSRAASVVGDHAVTLIEGDVTDFQFPAEKYSRVIHLATTSAEETYKGEDQLAKFHLLVKGTERVLKFAAFCKARRVLFTSSGVVYGAYPGELQRVPEQYMGAPDTTDPGSALGQAKRAAEYLCAYYANRYGFEYTIARCFSFVGPRLPLNIHYAVGNFIRDALLSKEIVVKGDGLPMRSFLYLGDLVVWMQALMVRACPSAIYNVGSDEAVSVLDLAKLVRSLLSPTKEVKVLGNSGHDVGNFVRGWYVPDVTRARDELGLEVWTPLRDAILFTADAASR